MAWEKIPSFSPSNDLKDSYSHSDAKKALSRLGRQIEAAEKYLQKHPGGDNAVLWMEGKMGIHPAINVGTSLETVRDSEGKLRIVVRDYATQDAIEHGEPDSQVYLSEVYTSLRIALAGEVPELIRSANAEAFDVAKSADEAASAIEHAIASLK